MENNFYIDKAPTIEAKQQKPPKPLTGSWWKYGLLLSGIQVILLVLLGYRLNPDFDIVAAALTGYRIYGTFILLSFLPFVFGRLGLTRLMWFALVGLFLGMGAYYLLALFEPTRRFNLLPFLGFNQFAFAGISLGVVWELGRYTFRKLTNK